MGKVFTSVFLHKGSEIMKLEMVRGTTLTFNISVMMNDAPYALVSGEKLVFGVRELHSDREAVLTKIVNTPSSNGVYQFKIVPEDTINLKYRDYFYDVGLMSGADYYNVIDPSPFILKKNATKWSEEE
jgi:hypothetical protein